jgi:hypothetical protein
LAGAITAYGKALGVLVAARREEEMYDIIRELSVSKHVSERVH